MSGPQTKIRPRISAIVTTFNEEEHVAACLESVAWCDEILVVDSYSTDRTVELAEGFEKVRLFQHEYHGGAAQKNWALQRARHEWILIFDADERCTPELRDEIQRLLEADPEADAYVIRRRVHFMGKVIRHSGWRNDRVVRLFRRGKARYQNRRVHSRVVTDSDEPAMYTAPVLESSMEHLMVDSMVEYIQRTRKYSYWGAAQLWKDGKRTTGLELLQRSVWRFLRTYVLQRGFLDGRHGLVFCLLQAVGTYMKLSMLWGWQINLERGIEPDLPSFDEDQDLWTTPEAEQRDAAPQAAERSEGEGPARASAGLPSAASRD